MDASVGSERQAEETAEEVVGASPQRLEFDVSLAAIVKILGVALGLWLVYRLAEVLLIVTISLMLVATFNPLVRRLEARYGRTGALTLVVVGIICIVALPLGLVTPIVVAQITNLVTHLPTYAQGLQVLLAHHGVRVNLEQGMQNILTSAAQGLPQLMSLLSNVLHHVLVLATVLVLTIYLLIEGTQVAQGLLRLLPRRHRLGVRRLCAELGTQVGAYMRGQLILSTLAGMFFLCLLLALGIPDAVALALVAAVADALPLAGLLIALLPACLSALAISSFKAGMVAGVYLFYHQLEANVIGPRVFGNTLGMRVSVVVIAILVGIELLGIVGAVLALPAAAALPILVRYLTALHEEIAATPEQPPTSQELHTGATRAHEQLHDAPETRPQP